MRTEVPEFLYQRKRDSLHHRGGSGFLVRDVICWNQHMQRAICWIGRVYSVKLAPS